MLAGIQEVNLIMSENKKKENQSQEQQNQEAMKQARDKKYNEYVKQVTPTHNLFLCCLKAFILGGAICTFGQVLIQIYTSMGANKEDSASWTTLTLILCSVVLTGLNIYPLFTKWGGAGSLVPITGFANSVVAPAIEYKKEGQVFGIGCKIFTIAGPVILFGILSSWVVGIIYMIIQQFMG